MMHYQPTTEDILAEKQTKLYNVFTDLIVELVTNYDNNDDEIRMLIDMRRRAYDMYTRLMAGTLTAY